MHLKNLNSIHRNFTQIAAAASGSMSIQLGPGQLIPIPKDSFFPYYTQELLISKLASVLQASLDNSVIQQGRQVHSQIISNGIDHHGLLGTRIMGMYVLCNKFMDAKNMFDRVNLSYASPWNWLIRGFTMMGCFDFAIMVYFKMLGYGTCPDKYTFPYVIKACGGLRAIGLAKSVQRTIQVMGYEMDVYVASSLIKLFAENGCIDDACWVFDRLPQKDSVLWNAMLNGYAKNGEPERVVGLFSSMRNNEIMPNSVTFACILSVCATEGFMRLGTQIHGLLVRCGLEMDYRVLNTLIAFYGKCQNLGDARRLFDAVAETDSIAWNGMIGGYVQNGFMPEALEMLRKMISAAVKPDSITLSSFLPAVSESSRVNQGKEIHCYIIRNGVLLDLFLKNALIDMYFKCRDMKMAHNVFNWCSSVDNVICTAMISGYALNGMNNDALEMFRYLLQEQMKPNAITLSSCLPACAGLAALKLGKELHGSILKNGLEGICYVGSAVSDMYAKCGRLDLANQVFMRISEKDAVCWNSMITSFSQNGKPGDAINLFREMGMQGAKYDSVSISAVLSACANLPSLLYGKEIHGFMVRGVLKTDLYAVSALIDMYAKCGNLELSRSVFDVMEEKNEVSWNSIIAAYGNHGHLEDCLSLFHEMERKGFCPDHVTFLAIISACGHAGLVDEGKHYFKCMEEDYGIAARMEHYACIIDLFSRAGRLKEAFEAIECMPFDPDAGVWGTLLGACHVHGNVELAELASRHVFDMDPQNSGYYVLLSNVQANAGKWEGVNKTRSMMKNRGVEKIPGYSWIEVGSTTHMFVAADRSHPQTAQIYTLLTNLLLELTIEGYVPLLNLQMKQHIDCV